MSVRSGPLPRLGADGSDERAVIRGYAAIFNEPDLSGDRIERGAFFSSVAARGAAGIRMLWQHDSARPIGTWVIVREDRTGLFAEGRIALDSQHGREAVALIRAGAVDGLSIGFKAKRARRDADRNRRLVEIDLWEISVVTFPMQEQARITGIGGEPLPPLALRLGDCARRLAAIGG
ncbi:HK97 family phage prohead protease [Mangrovicella endophytica]|uniref:HK97 family phage prohead protease n=1 Tax=Mangrovicella endophytica TaxID=2066697 RepID=UPI001FDF2D7A|nr:HK97 family phage prohead protease [Mangrovicella endophytica]